LLRILFLLLIAAVPAAAAELPLQQIVLPPGFQISLYARIPDARSLQMTPQGVLFVGTRKAGRVWALADRDGDGRAEERHLIARDLAMPNGIAFLDGDLYVAETRRILRYPDILSRLPKVPAAQVVYDELPPESHHGWRYLKAGPDGKLYLAIGAPCNVCLAPGYAVIARLNPDGSRFEIFAEGVRNSVGFDWHPDTGVLWFTDNGRDWLGDNRPPDELNRAPHAGLHFGFPFCHGRSVPDPEFGRSRHCAEFVPPALELGAHVAPLGLRFYRGRQFPAAWRNVLFLAEHGSWNRSRKVGYRLMQVRIRDGKVVENKVFAAGWLQGQTAWGRPVDVAVAPDGALLVSDDKAGAIYRIVWRRP
jgi:glucose/arabinose dehydrogenase